jgi:Fe-Mn family superoxide dismutase
MSFELMRLGFNKVALEPVMSGKTIEFHWGKHHQAYVNNINALVLNTKLEDKSLEEIIRLVEPGPIFNNSAQVYNHNFFWQCLRAPARVNKPSGKLEKDINAEFGSFESFKEQLSDLATKHFGSGWIWLVKSDSELALRSLHDADNPIRHNEIPLLALDVWEHAYYIDYQNNRPEYINNIWKIINWDFVVSNYEKI